VSNLTEVDKRYLEKILGMEGGFLLDYNDMTFGKFFDRHGIAIHSTKYQIYGTSKAKKMRAFWENETDALVGKVLSEMLDVYEASCKLNNKGINADVLQETRKIAVRLLGKQQPAPPSNTGDDFLSREFTIPNIKNLPIEAWAVPIIESRLAEARKALGAGAYLSVILLCGSVLEAVLLGAALKEPSLFNQSAGSPKTNDGKVKHFSDWSLAQFIDVACEIDLLKADVKKFSHGLRDFRNYIHPYEQMVSRFTPDEHTAKVCFHVLKAALASVAGERK
jgi:hypothetical protein